MMGNTTTQKVLFVSAVAFLLLFASSCSAFQTTIQLFPSPFRVSHSIVLDLAKKSNNNNNNENLVGSISSDGGGAQLNQRRSTGSLGVSKKPRKKKESLSSTRQKPLSKKERQRTGNGQVDSTKQAIIADPENENIQVVEGKRGNKVVTIVRGMTSPMDTRKKLLKAMKKSFGVGGTIVDGVLEIQGAYAERAVQVLHKQGYAKARKIGK